MCEGESPLLNDVRRFMASTEGQRFLRGIHDHLQDRTIADVTFQAYEHGIATTLSLDSGETYDVLCSAEHKNCYVQ